MRRFIEWDSLDVRISGDKLAELAREMVAKDPMIEKLDLKFSNGMLRVEGMVRKFILIPSPSTSPTSTRREPRSASPSAA